jgi:lipopolysaccharide/colanic/teichoic acid biosynthesis glycosyltransferase
MWMRDYVARFLVLKRSNSKLKLVGVVVKRLFDIVIAFVALIILLIPILIVSVMVKLTSQGTAFYWSDRVGRNNVSVNRAHLGYQPGSCHHVVGF